MNKIRLLFLGTALLAAALAAQQPARPAWPTTEGDFTVANFHFTDGEVLPHAGAAPLAPWDKSARKAAKFTQWRPAPGK